MPETEPKPAEKTPVKAEPKKNSITTTVFAPAGGVPKNQVISSAIASVRDAIPVVYELNAEITGAKKVEGGTNFEVTVTYTPRELAGDHVDPVNPDAVIKGLEVPKSVDGLLGAEGDPDFLNQR